MKVNFVTQSRAALTALLLATLSRPSLRYHEAASPEPNSSADGSACIVYRGLAHS